VQTYSVSFDCRSEGGLFNQSVGAQSLFVNSA
jgi:hypothetical protein